MPPGAALPRGTIMTACCLGMTTLCLAMAPAAMCLPNIGEELAMTLSERGVFLSAAFWGFVVAILVAGPLADRLGFRALLVIGFALKSAGLLTIAAAGAKTTALAGGLIVGLGCGVADALLTPIVCAIYPERRMRMTSLLHSFYAIGLVMTVAVIMLLLRLDWHWRTIFRLLAVLPAPYALAALVLPLPRQSHEGPSRLTGRALVRKGAFLALILAILMGGVTEIAPSTWLPSLIKESGGPRGLGLLLFGVALALGRLSVSALVGALGPRRVFTLAAGASAACLTSAALTTSPTMTVISLSALGFAVAGFWPTIVASAGDRYPQGGASMYSLLAAAGSFGGVIGPVTVGVIADQAGLRAGLGVLTVAPIIIGAVMFVLLRPRPAGRTGKPQITGDRA